MIARLSGILEEKNPDQLVVDVNGVGYQVFVSLQTFYRLPALHERVNLHVHTNLREDALQLYGFLEEKEKMTFLLLKGVTGIGPRLALNILSGIPVDELEGALRTSDVTRLVAVPGVGKKLRNVWWWNCEKRLAPWRMEILVYLENKPHCRPKRSRPWSILGTAGQKRKRRYEMRCGAVLLLSLI